LNRVDLHIHSDVSDGLLTPSNIVREVKKAKLPGFSLTDHDTFDQTDMVIDYLLVNDIDLYFLAGCEFSTQHYKLGEVHMLAYFTDFGYLKMQKLTNHYKEARRKRAEKIIKRLEDQGFHINEDMMNNMKDKTIGRLHIAREIVKMGYVRNIYHAFENFLSKGSSCYVPNCKADTFDVLSEIKSAGGISVVAHPTFLREANNWTHLKEMAEKGMDGIEYKHPKISKRLAKEIYNYAYGKMILTGGSDFHGDNFTEYVGKCGIKREMFAMYFGGGFKYKELRKEARA
jgi:3',5'-nucleoside bisphosphate phosphatase